MARPYKSILTRRQLQDLATRFRRTVDRWLDARLDRYFDRVEAAFAAAAEQATEAQRPAWLEARRALADHRKRIGEQFRGHLLKAVEIFFLHFEAYLEEFIHGASATGLDRPRLVKDPRFTEALTVLTMVQRATRHQKAERERLAAHLAAVIQPREVGEDGFPLAPTVVATCLLMALQRWPGHAASRLVFFEVLADELLADLDRLYPDLLEALTQLGLEPLDSGGTAACSLWSAGGEGGVGGGRKSGQRSLFALIGLVRSLDERQRRLMGLMPPVASPGPAATALRPEVVARAVAPLGERLGGAADLQAAREAQAVFKQALAENLQATARAARLRIHCLDQQVIDVITLVFDFLLDDDLVPEEMRLRLLPLEVPLIQAAVTDKTLLSESNHPARRLLDLLVQAAAQWGDCIHPTSRTVHAAVERAVTTVLEGDPMDPELFQRVTQNLDRLIQARVRGARVVEERVTQVARGREHLMLARRQVARVLADFDVERLPGVARRLVDEGWRDLLVLTLLREGEESAQWQWALDVVQRLVAGIRDDDPIQLERDLPGLLADLRRGLSVISWESSRVSNLLERLEACWRARMRGTSLVPEICGQPTVARQRSASPAVPAWNERHRRVVENLEEGQWLRWHTPAGERRGKLAWRSRAADLLLLVDVRGHKLAEFSSAELQELLARGRARLLDGVEEPFVERAIQSLRLMLETHRAGPRIRPVSA